MCQSKCSASACKANIKCSSAAKTTLVGIKLSLSMQLQIALLLASLTLKAAIANNDSAASASNLVAETSIEMLPYVLKNNKLAATSMANKQGHYTLLATSALKRKTAAADIADEELADDAEMKQAIWQPATHFVHNNFDGFPANAPGFTAMANNFNGLTSVPATLLVLLNLGMLMYALFGLMNLLNRLLTHNHALPLSAIDAVY